MVLLVPSLPNSPAEFFPGPAIGVFASAPRRFAKLGRAKVLPLLPRITASGYEVQVLPAWADFPSEDPVADTTLMNARLRDYIETMPAQYYWVHKRFKTRPEGDPSLY